MRRLFPFLLVFLFVAGFLWAADDVEPMRLSLRRLVEKAEEGDGKAMYELATLHDRGFDSIPVDSVRSTSLYLRAAEKGYAPAMNFLGFRYYTGNHIRHDIDSALFWIRKAADAGDITAAANLGYLLSDSPDIPHDIEEASKWLSVATEAGVREAQFKLIELKNGAWQELEPDSALNLGIKYYTGKAPIAGFRLLEIASDKGIPKAKALLGDAYSKGLGTPYDHNKSVEYFYEAAQEGDPSAQFIIAELLEFFPDVLNDRVPTIDNPAPYNESEDILSPLYWYSKASEQGISDSETAYSRLYSHP